MARPDAKVRASGADFAALAKASSEHTQSSASGGDLGWLTENQILPEVRAAVTQLKPGWVTGAVKTAQGWHVVKLLERKDIQVLPLADVRDRIVAALRYRKAQENAAGARRLAELQAARDQRAKRQFDAGHTDRVELTLVRLEALAVERNVLAVGLDTQRALSALEDALQIPLAGAPAPTWTRDKTKPESSTLGLAKQ